MLYKLLSVENYTPSNIGDYIQALAASQFLPRIDGFINREDLSDYAGEECKVIMNGWYMHNPQKWPPSCKIHPLFVSLHINIHVESTMLSTEGIKYLKQHEPIGCRDEHTRDTLRSNGVDAYFSGCLTLTLGNKYTTSNRGADVFFVDPHIPKENHIGILLKDALFMLEHPRLTCDLSNRMRVGASKIKNLLRTARFGRLYSQVFSHDTLLCAKYVSQENDDYSLLSNEERLQEAERLVRMYSQAALVVTSRIHCALPSLGMGTPVYFVQRANDKIGSSCRFGGLIDLFNVIKVSSNKVDCPFMKKDKLSLRNIVPNKETWKVLASSLTDRCSAYVNND